MDVATGAVERVEHPAPLAARRAAELLAEHGVARPHRVEVLAHGGLDVAVDVGDHRAVGLALHAQPAAEAGQGHLVGHVGQLQRDAEVRVHRRLTVSESSGRPAGPPSRLPLRHSLR